MSDTTRLEVNDSEIVSLNDVQNIKAYIDFAGADQDNNLVAIGWVFDTEAVVSHFALLSKLQQGIFKKTTFLVKPLLEETENIFLSRVKRLDVAQAMSSSESTDIFHGFVLVIPEHNDEDILTLCLTNGKYVKLSFNTIRRFSEMNEAFKKLWPHSGRALTSLLTTALGSDNDLSQQASDLSEANDSLIQINKDIATDHVLWLDKQALIINGWISKPQEKIERVDVFINEVKFSLDSALKRYVRPDLYEGLPWSRQQALGYLCVLTDLPHPIENIKIQVEFTDGTMQSLRASVTHQEWSQMAEFMTMNAAIAPLLLELLKNVPVNQRRQVDWAARIVILMRERMQSLHRNLPTHIDQLPLIASAIDRSYPMGADGLLFFGWHVLPDRKPTSVTLIDEDGVETNITQYLSSLRRMDVVQAYSARVPKINEWSGFVGFVPIPTISGQTRALCFDFAEMGKVWLKIPTDHTHFNGLSVVKEVLGAVPEPDRMKYRLYELFESGFGKALELLNAKRAAAPQAQARQFGVPVRDPEITVLVPLYGRYDFLRHQLAQFADDADFKKTDLIYIVDDPTILPQTLELAAKYHPLFNVPFRVISNGENQGFAAANNLGARFAKSPILVLLNSDVIPQHNGWLTTLKDALDALPQAGAVAPLLQFGDGTIQHAGMYPREDPMLPGFLLNTHRGMGTEWAAQSNTPSEHPMLTAACLMLKTAEYRAVGGLDEGYVLGDFEDSDLCLTLRKKGLKLYLVPEAKLWHLERQSQTLQDLASVRQMVTMFNSWRYLNKIKTGLLASPSMPEVSI